MLTGFEPFFEAHDKDNFYKFLAMGRADIFWHAHALKHPGGFTKEFTDLLTSMF